MKNHHFCTRTPSAVHLSFEILKNGENHWKILVSRYRAIDPYTLFSGGCWEVMELALCAPRNPHQLIMYIAYDPIFYLSLEQIKMMSETRLLQLHTVESNKTRTIWKQLGISPTFDKKECYWVLLKSKCYMYYNYTNSGFCVFSFNISDFRLEKKQFYCLG